MVTTNHSLARMSQRGLTKTVLDLVYKFGHESGDKLTLTKKESLRVLAELDVMRKEFLRIIDKGGVTVVVVNDILVTAYNTNSQKSY